jgi:hypothetical protein
VNHSTWHVTQSYILFGTDVLFIYFIGLLCVTILVQSCWQPNRSRQANPPHVDVICRGITSQHTILSSDENGPKRTEKPYFYFRFYIFLAETESGSKNTGSETELEYADIRK